MESDDKEEEAAEVEHSTTVDACFNHGLVSSKKPCAMPPSKVNGMYQVVLNDLMGLAVFYAMSMVTVGECMNCQLQRHAPPGK